MWRSSIAVCLVLWSVDNWVGRRMLHIPDMDRALNPWTLDIPISEAQIRHFRRDGFLILRNVLNQSTLETIRNTANHIADHPNGLLKRSNGSAFCGFSLHTHLLLPRWRRFAYQLPFRLVAERLMNTTSAVYAQDIFHRSTPACVRTSRAHSDANQGPFSVERTHHWGDNMVVTWLPLDDEAITLELWPKSHGAAQSGRGFNGTAYCAERPLRSPPLTVRNPQPGDVVFWQGLTMHRVHVDPTAALTRRLTIRYLDAQVTRWRTDVPTSRWPVIRNTAVPGALVGSSIPLSEYSYGPWLPFLWHMLWNGWNASDLIHVCVVP